MNSNLRKLQRCTACALAAVLALPTPLLAQNAAPGAKPAVSATSVSPALRSGNKVTLNFVNADIEAVTRAFAAMIERQIMVDPRVKGSITVYSEQPLSVREAYLTYLSALRGMGFAVVDSAGVLKVLPEADARLQATPVLPGSSSSSSARTGQILTQIFTLKHENPNNLVPILRPLITANNTINVNPSTSSLIITDYAENLQRLATIITTLDQPSSTDFEVVPLEHAVAADVATLVQRLADGGGAAAVIPGAPSAAGSSSVIADNRSNSLIIRAPNQARMQALRATIARLDRPSSGGPGGNIWVVHLKNADAVKLATVLRAAFGGAAGGGGGAGSTTPRAQAFNPGAGAQAGTQGGASAAATAPIAASAEPSTGGFVQADPATNSLIITAPEPLYRQVRSMIDQLDTRRAQIYIESLIVEVSGNDLADFGFQWQALSGQRGDSSIVAGGTSFENSSRGLPSILDLSVAAAGGRATAAAALAAMPGGFNIGVLRNLGNGLYGLSAVARALQDRGNTNIMSTPNLITVDNEEAKIVVGDNVPFITGSFTNTGTATTNPFQTIERRDVGLTLRIKPQIGEGGTIRMAIFQESSSVSTPAAGTSGAGPTTSKRAIESNVIVDDGSILVLGGLIEDRYIETKSKVPLLGDLPYLGALFRSEARERKRTNLMVFLRPVVMRTAEDAKRLSLDRYDMIRSQQKDFQPTRNPLLPINEAPVLPPLRPEATPAPGLPIEQPKN